MARHGENIRKRKDGRWEGRYPVYSQEKGRNVYRSVYGRSYQEAKGKLEAGRRRDGTGQTNAFAAGVRTGKAGKWPEAGFPPGTGVKYEYGPFFREGAEEGAGIEFQNQRLFEGSMFTDLAGQWLDQVKENRKPSTYAKYRQIFRQYLETPFQNTEIFRITDQLVGQQISDPLTDSVRKSIYCVLNQILRFAS